MQGRSFADAPRTHQASMMSKRTLWQRVRNRIAWEVNMQQVGLRRTIWQLLSTGRQTALSEHSMIYRDKLVPALSADAPILNEPNARYVTFGDGRYLCQLHTTAYMEPKHGYVIALPNVMLDASLPGTELAFSRSTMHFFSGLPSLSQFFLARTGYLPIQKEDSIISMRFVFDTNYFHFYHDVMSRLQLLDELGIDQQIPLVVSEQLANTSFFTEMVARGNLANRRWIVQKGFYIQANQTYFACVAEAGRQQLDYFLNCVEAPEGDPSHNRRIFLMRKPIRGRSICNLDEILPLLQQFRFELIDTDDMSIEEQMVTFSQASIVVGIHGAGLTNIVFRRNACLTVLEIFPPHETSVEYYRLAQLYGYSHAYIRGHSALTSSRQTNFKLDPGVLAHALDDLGVSQDSSL